MFAGSAHCVRAQGTKQPFGDTMRVTNLDHVRYYALLLPASPHLPRVPGSPFHSRKRAANLDISLDVDL